MLTQKDLDEINKLIDKKFDEKLKYLPTKDEFFGAMDKLMKELKAMREEVTVVTGYKDQIEDHETRLGKVETILNIPS